MEIFLEFLLFSVFDGIFFLFAGELREGLLFPVIKSGQNNLFIVLSNSLPPFICIDNHM